MYAFDLALRYAALLTVFVQCVVGIAIVVNRYFVANTVANAEAGSY